MSSDKYDHDELDPTLPEAVVDWVDSGRPDPMPREVEAWLEQRPEHFDVLRTLTRVWGETAPPSPPAGLWEGVQAMLGTPAGGPDRASSATRPASPAVRRGAPRQPLLVAAVLVLGLGLGLVWPHLQSWIGPTPDMVALEIPAGSRSTLALPGGINIRLNSDSRVSYRPDGHEVTEVALEGEAYFEVPHNPDRTFIVITPSGVIRDIGTEFNVHARGGRVAVVVAEGEVALTSSQMTLNVIEGQKATATASDPPRIDPDLIMSSELAWLDGRFAFHDMRLEEIATELGRHYNADVDVSEPLRGQRVTVVLDAPAEIGTALNVVCQAISARCTRTADGWVVGPGE